MFISEIVKEIISLFGSYEPYILIFNHFVNKYVVNSNTDLLLYFLFYFLGGFDNDEFNNLNS